MIYYINKKIDIYNQINMYQQRKGCRCMSITLGVFTALAVLAVVAQSIVGVITISNQNSLQRYCGEATGPKMGTASNGVAITMISLRSNEREIEWDIQYKDFTGLPVGVHIHGPTPPGLDFGPLAIALCGTPSTLACDTSVAGKLTGKITQVSPGGGPLKPVIQAIRDEPCRYAVRIKTSAFLNGEVRLRLCSLCGTP